MTTGVLVLSHGTPASLDEVEAFYTRIRRGRPPTPELLDDLVRRYAALGGTSPLTARTEEQVAGLRATLAARAPGAYVVEGATKYATPTIEAACELLVAKGVGRVVGIVLAPLDAPVTTDQYHDRAREAIAERVAYTAVREWWDAPGFVELLAGRLTEAIGRSGADPLVLFSAHSIPTRVDPDGRYPAQLSSAAASVAARAGVARFEVCWQSAGRTADEWYGPDLLEVLGGREGARAVVVCPLGFVSDHLEVLYDVDLEARQVAREHGAALVRTRSLNDDPAFLDVLAGVVASA